MLTITVDVPPGEWLTSNMRRHWRDRAARTKALRNRGLACARAAGVTTQSHQVRVIVEVVNRTNRRFDPGNVSPAVKAVMDGFTDAHLWADDDAQHVVGPDYRAGIPDPTIRPQWHRLIFTIAQTEETQ